VGLIRVLPDHLCNRIAAGEVVERPASVVKELVENALDAGSRRILVEIEAGGTRMIRVADDGAGMAADDTLLCLERHATSKIASADDLAAIRTLGFRGEALPSIAAVSRFTLVSRPAAAASGTEVRVESGRIVRVQEVGAAAGTEVRVEQLFGNLPARRKFLRGVATETGHVAETLAALVMAWPGVQVSLRHNGRELRGWPATANGAERVAQILGLDLQTELAAVAADTETGRVTGWIAHPRAARASARGIYLYVNGRWIRDRGMLYALLDSYGVRLMRGQYPPAALFLELPPSQVDVNVHPSKSEVRFADGPRVQSLVRAAVRDALLRLDAPARTPLGDPAAGLRQRSAPQAMNAALPFAGSRPAPVAAGPWPDAVADRGAPEPAVGESPAPFTPTAGPSEAIADWQVIGQYLQSYILCQAGRDLVLVDQHAAHERVLYEALGRSQAPGPGGAPQQQRLLLPETVDLSPVEAAAVTPLLPELARLGLALEPFGGQSVLVTAIPAPLQGRAAEPLVRQIAELAVQRRSAGGIEDLLDQSRRLMACHGSIRAHQAMTPAEQAALLRQLDACAMPACCPHGRPTFLRWPLAALERLFRRLA
jgi:DNA mismatch repair protein MutL